MDAAHAIELEGVGKRLRLRRTAASLKAAAIERLRGRRGEFLWALREVSFEARRGETLGIIGANGAGKTTLLSLVAGTMRPTEGAIRTRGSVSSLLELGAGFHPDLTGRENVFLAGTIMGLRRRQIRERFDAIVEFAGLHAFIDQPVRHYSSGMYVRLGFAVAVEVDPDILLVDEVLAVGDIDFQQRCIERMRAFHEAGKTMLIVSHDLPTIQALSDRILLLDAGRVVEMGRPGDVVGRYRAETMREVTGGLTREWGTGEIRIVGVEIRDRAGRPAETVASGGTLTAVLRYRAARRIERPVFGFALSDRTGRRLYGSNTQIAGLAVPFVEGEGTLTLELAPLTLAEGGYLLSFSAHSEDHRIHYHRIDHAFPLVVEGGLPVEGPLYIPARWTLPG